MNILSLLVMTMKLNRNILTCVFMSITAVNDNIVLSLAFYRWLVENTHFPQLTDWGSRL